jgi:hypothetical protein|tara:strand:- start:619 stop:864 length:246 start_codon:yes stop_codon:yes gene_type:complete
MPTYDFRDKKTQEVIEKQMKIAERDQFLKDNPHLESIMSTPMIVSGVDGLRKPDDSFRDILRNIDKKHPSKKNTMNQNVDF